MAAPRGKEKLSFCAKMDRSCRSFANFAYNKQTGEVMGRSGKSWAKIGLFYLAYYSFLAAFFSSCLAVFLSTLNDPGKGGPKNIQFLVGDSAPGLTTVPAVKTLKGYSGKKASNVLAMKDYLRGFGNSGFDGGSCSVQGSKSPCKYDLSKLGNCQGNNSFGYDAKKPCVFIKINKVYGWKPSANIKLKCTAKGKDVKVFPDEGYLKAAFPFAGQDFYMTPPVAIQIDNTAGDELEVQCELDGPGIKTSESFITDRAFGKIEFKLKP